MKVFWSLFTKLNFPSHLFFLLSRITRYEDFSFKSCCCSRSVVVQPSHPPNRLFEILISASASILHSFSSRSQPSQQFLHYYSTRLMTLFFDGDDVGGPIQVVYACMLRIEEIVEISSIQRYHITLGVLFSLSFLVQFWQWIIDFFPLHFTLKFAVVLLSHLI